jgi:hypothetical protein
VKTPVFYTVTNNAYFNGTLATINSIRLFYPNSVIYVFSESRKPLSDTQVSYLKLVPSLNYYSCDQIDGKIKEAWQMKAHAYLFLQNQLSDDNVLVHLDSDAILASDIDDLILASDTRVTGGKDGVGVKYKLSEYIPYYDLCDSGLEHKDYNNSNYMSTSVFVSPVSDRMHSIAKIWSIAVDSAKTFGPPDRSKKVYAGYSDQGLFNAILFFTENTPNIIDNEILSEHWTHGRAKVHLNDEGFVRNNKKMLAFHSVGHSPKFWSTKYLQKNSPSNISNVYNYWLWLIYCGPIGLTNFYTIEEIQKLQKDMFCGFEHHLKDFIKMESSSVRNWPAYHKMYRSTDLKSKLSLVLPKNLNINSDECLVIHAYEGFRNNQQSNYFYSAVRRAHLYRAAGGRGDVIILINDYSLEHFVSDILLRKCIDFNITIGHVGNLSEYLKQNHPEIDFSWQENNISSIVKNPSYVGLDKNYALVYAHHAMMCRHFVLHDLVEKYRGSKKKFLQVDADGGGYLFYKRDIGKFDINDVWRFDEFCDLLVGAGRTLLGSSKRLTKTGFCKLFSFDEKYVRFPTFQIKGFLFQGTADAILHFIEQFPLAIEHFKNGSFLLDLEHTILWIIQNGKNLPYGVATVGRLQDYLIVVNKQKESEYIPFFPLVSESKYKRRVFPIRPEIPKSAISIVAFDGKHHGGDKKFSSAALDRARFYKNDMRGAADIHIFTDSEYNKVDGITFHKMTPDDMVKEWSDVLSTEFCIKYWPIWKNNKEKVITPSSVKRAEYAVPKFCKLIAVDRLLKSYDVVMSADADGDQFSQETLGCTTPLPIDYMWNTLGRIPFAFYHWYTGKRDSHGVDLGLLKRISECPNTNQNTSLDWIWGPCWSMSKDFGHKFMANARLIMDRLAQECVPFSDEHLLNCTYGLPVFNDNPGFVVKDLGEAALIGARYASVNQLTKIQRWNEDSAIYTGRPYRSNRHMWKLKPEFNYRD